MGEPKRYYRSRTDRVLGGVCGGLGRYLGIDPVIIRVAWVVVTVASAGAGLLAYILLWLLAPEEPGDPDVADAPAEPEREPPQIAERRAVAPTADEASKAAND